MQILLRTRIVSFVCLVLVALAVWTFVGAQTKDGHARGVRETRGYTNVFPWPWCTWGADQEYFYLHRYFVPWRTNASAYQWTARAREFQWHVSTRPHHGAIINLQPGIQGASAFGHVAVVVRVIDTQHVQARGTSWGAHPTWWTTQTFHTGPGVTFLWH